MSRLLESLLGLVPGLSVVIILVVLGVYWVQRLRRDLSNESGKNDDLHEDFLKMRREGKISEKEYQEICRRLSPEQQPGNKR
ncbi:MAG: hypothetical protein ACUVQG_07730 [Thermogutta sp.]